MWTAQLSKTTRKREDECGRRGFRGKITEYLIYTPTLKNETGTIQRRQRKLEGMVETEKDGMEPGGGNDEATCLKWKQLMMHKPDNGIKRKEKTKFKKGKGKTKLRGAKSVTGKGHGSKGVTDSSQLKMGQFFLSRGKGNSPGSGQN